MTRLRFRSTFASLVIAALALPPLPALAQTDEQRAAARDLAIDGADAFDQGRYEDAIDRFTRAESLVHATPHLLYLARAHAKLRQYVKAREAYMKIIREPLAANAPQALKDAKESASSEISQVEPKIGRLTVTVPGKENLQNLTVQVDGTPIPAVLVGAPQPVDPGEHRIEAIATGFRAPPKVVTFLEGEQKAVSLKMVEDPTAAPPAPADAPAAAQPGPAAAPVDSPPRVESGGSSGLLIGGLVGLGVGALGLGAGTYFMIDASGKRSDADDLCEEDAAGECNPANATAIKKLDGEADDAGTLGIVGFAVGGVGVAAGITLLILSSGSGSSSGKGASGLKVAPYLTPRSLGISGVF